LLLGARRIEDPRGRPREGELPRQGGAKQKMLLGAMRIGDPRGRPRGGEPPRQEEDEEEEPCE